MHFSIHVMIRLVVLPSSGGSLVFFFNDTATTEIYTLSLHDALPISACSSRTSWRARTCPSATTCSCRPSSSRTVMASLDRKSTRLNSSHGYISYAVFCLKKKKNKVYHILCLISLFSSLSNQPHVSAA